MRDTEIINNTFIAGSERVLFFDVGKRSANAGNVIANNIFYWAGMTNDSPILIRDATGLLFTNNIWQGVNAGPAAGANDVAGNPDFSNVSGQSPDDFRIGLSSPAAVLATQAIGLAWIFLTAAGAGEQLLISVPFLHDETDAFPSV